MLFITESLEIKPRGVDKILSQADMKEPKGS